MTIWKKYYLISVTLLALVLNISLFTLGTMQFKQDISSKVQSLQEEEQNILRQLKTFYVLEVPDEKIEDTMKSYQHLGVYVSYGALSGKFVTNFPAGVEMQAGLFQPEGIKKINRHWYRVVHKKVLLASKSVQKDERSVFFLEDVSNVYQAHHRRLLLLCLTSLVLTGGLAFILYVTMKRLYRPIENIAHDIRTPLTSIKGYSEFLLRAKTDEAEKITILQDIIDESNHLQNIVEQLLLMGNLKAEALPMEMVDLNNLLQEMQRKIPEIRIKGLFPKMYGNPTLLQQLFLNLSRNAVDYGEQAQIFAEDERIIVENTGAVIPPELLESLQRKKAIPPVYIKGTGRGLQLCQQIMSAHKGKIQFAAGDNGGLKITLIFPNRKQTA